MDIVRSKKKEKIQYKRWLAITAISLIAVGLVINLSGNSSAYHVGKSELLIAEVQRGQLNISVRGFGVLVPKDVRWVATNVEGRVERILIKAGAKVKKVTYY
jgi:multidrug efflux pump subunit AcrA (membrane-fusion protein)